MLYSLMFLSVSNCANVKHRLIHFLFNRKSSFNLMRDDRLKHMTQASRGEMPPHATRRFRPYISDLNLQLICYAYAILKRNE